MSYAHSPSATIFSAPILFAITCFLLTGCSLLDATDTHVRTRGKLTDAAEEAQKPPEEQDSIPDTVVPNPDYEDDPDADETESVLPNTQRATGTPDSGLGPATPEPEVHMAHAGIIVGGGSHSHGALERVRTVGLQFGGYTWPRERIDIQFLYDDVQLNSRGNGLEHAKQYTLDGAFRYYLTSDHTFMGAYGLAGLRVGLLTWDFQNPVEGVKDDLVPYVGFYGGIGFSPIQTRYVHFGANVAAGARVYREITYEGFENDLFQSGFFTQILFEAILVRPGVVE